MHCGLWTLIVCPILSGKRSGSKGYVALDLPPTKRTQLARTSLTALNTEGVSLQICQHLCRLGSSYLIQHMIAAKRTTEDAVAEYEAEFRQAWQRLLGLFLTNEAWTRGSLLSITVVYLLVLSSIVPTQPSCARRGSLQLGLAGHRSFACSRARWC